MDKCDICKIDTLLRPGNGNRYYCTPCYITKYKVPPLTNWTTFKYSQKHNKFYIKY